MGLFGVKLLVQGFFGVILEVLEFFLGFDFCPNSIILVISIQE